MSNFCIVCEFNPLHNGHAYLISKARAMGADTVTCIMSGNAVQRGELALTDKYVRAEAAIKCGADLVLELPYPWSAASAERFASAAVGIAEGLGDSLLFGSECGAADKLLRAAELCETVEFDSGYAQRLKRGEGAAGAFLGLLADNGFDGFGSNDLLGIAYMRAIKRSNASIRPVTVARRGAAYNELSTVDGELQSATAIRRRIENGELEKIYGYVPSAMAELLRREAAVGRLTDMREAQGAFLGFFRLSDVNGFKNIAEAGGGLAERLCAAASRAVSYAELLELADTKRYTSARVRRGMLYCMTDVDTELLASSPKYTLLLAANGAGRSLLAGKRRDNGVKIVTKPADAPRDCRQYEASAKLDALYGLARKNKMPADEFFKRGAYIEK